jgi:hypothetical protein
MHTILRCSVAGLLVCAALARPAAAQSLGDVARKEQARRKTAQAGKVYTNENLPSMPQPSQAPAPRASAVAAQQGDAGAAAAPQQPAPPEAAAPAGSGSGDAGRDKAKKDEAHWRDRMSKERDTLARAESFAEALQSRINALSTDFVNRDDPAQRGVIAADRDKALAELERVRKEVDDHKKAIAAIQEEARRTGVPAGWVR